LNVRTVEWVVKISKQCNLRCSYCYEFPFLADRARMSLDELRTMFRHIALFYAGSSKRMDFVWHGGEPLLIEPAYYHQIFTLQEQELGRRGVAFTNSVQTNLTVLTPSVLSFLKSDAISNIGVSLDLFGDQRVNIAGRPSQPAVLRNMQRLLDEGMRFGCITVLSRATARHIDAIYDFFEEIDTSFRLLPVYRTGYPGQQDELALSDEEIVDAFKHVVDRWLRSESSIQVRPIQDYITHVVAKLGRAERNSFYDKISDEVVYIVEPDGSLYSVADPPDEDLCHGNLFRAPLAELKQSAGYLRAVAAANSRLEEACSDCTYYGICSGYFMGEATPEQRTSTENGRVRCGVARPVQNYIEQILLASEVLGADGKVLQASETHARSEMSRV
jgi:uncharacterized protein